MRVHLQKLLVPVVCLTLTVGARALFAQAQYPETLWVPVIFYDYRANGTNPDFEPSGYTGSALAAKGMVNRTLTADRKVQAAMTGLNVTTRSTNLSNWYRPSGNTGEIPAVFGYNPTLKRWEWTGLKNYNGRANEWVGPYFNANDPMANIVIYDSLAFLLIDATNGTYEFRDDDFFPLDNRGFGVDITSYPDYDWTNTENHNFSFTMEIHSDFSYKQGLNFDFTGDDDVWAFINGNLVMDIGGIHGAISDAIDLDTMGLTDGRRYPFDFFYAERHVTESHILITTNILSPGNLRLEFIGDSLLTAGLQENILHVILLDESGVPIEHNPSQISWQLLSPLPGDTLFTLTGDTARVYGEVAHRMMRLRATYVDPETGVPLITIAEIMVSPGPADHVVIEPNDVDPLTASPNRDNPTARIDLPLADENAQATAVTRDRFQNYVDYARTGVWASVEPNKALVAAQAGQNWIGIITRGPSTAAQSDSTLIVASQAGLRSDSVRVYLWYMLQAQTPTANPPTTVYVGDTTVTLTAGTAGSTIYYCLNCTGFPAPGDPVWQLYTGPLTINATGVTELKAYATKQDYTPSTIMVERYTKLIITVETPVIFPAGRQFYGRMVLDSIVSGTPGATIFYCINCPEATAAGDPQWLVYRPGQTVVTIGDPGTTVVRAYADIPGNADYARSGVRIESYVNLDSEGPYATQALLYLGDPYGLTPGTPDTLIVTFNEPVICAEAQAVAAQTLFNLTSKDPAVDENTALGGATYLACAGDTVTRVTIILNPNAASELTPYRDSIAVKAGQLEDLYGNLSTDKPPVVIRYGRDYSWTSRNAPNPFTPGKGPGQEGSPIPVEIVGRLDPQWIARNAQEGKGSVPQSGTVIEVISIKNPDLTRCEMLVLDALGNVVVDGLPAYPTANNPNTFYFFWNGYNRNNRVVGSGTYLARIFIYAEGEATPGIKQQKIGVRN